MDRVYKKALIISILDLIPVNGKKQKKEIITSVYWADADYFQSRSFDVLLCHAKKELQPKKFKCNSGIITRIN